MDHNPFDLTLNSSGGYAILSNTEALDFETRCVYQLAVAAVDGGGLVSAEPVRIEVRVQDVNEYPAVFVQSAFSLDLLENDRLDTVLSFSDRDKEGVCADNEGSDLTFSVRLVSHSSTEFPIHSNSAGRLRSNVTLDYESDTTMFHFVVSLQDGLFMDSANLSVRVLDQNEYSPVFLQTQYSITLNESAEVGTPIFLLSASDDDGSSLYGGVVEYRIVSADQSPLPFAVQPDGQVELVIPVDYDERDRHFRFSVTAVDGGGRQATIPAPLRWRYRT